MDFRYKRRYAASNGHPGGSNNRTGAYGEDVYIRVPAGTIIYEAESDNILADLVEEGQTFLAAAGGRGGCGNAHFKSSRNQAPRRFQPGQPGEACAIRLELKLLADVGLVGLPNAGKSTLLSRMSDARPKIAPYPFTTLIPNLGIVRVDEYRSFVMADIPGLIKGAHLGKGLGDEFLKHIERTRLLVFLIDFTESDLRRAYDTLLEELRLFNSALLQRPRLVILTKTDLLHDVPEQFSMPIDLTISSVTGKGIRELTGMIVEKLDI